MPEGPELRLASQFVNKVASKHLFSGPVVKSVLASKLPEVPFEAESYALHSESRGKELKVFLRPQNVDDDKKVERITVRGGKLRNISLEKLKFWI
jgi:hypothetical protein